MSDEQVNNTQPTQDPQQIGTDPKTGKPLRVVILNQYWEPDVASTGQLLHQLGAELVKLGFDVEAWTTPPSWGPPESWVDVPKNETRDGVRVRRVFTLRFSKDNLPGRLFSQFLFLFMMSWRALFSRSDTVYLYTTNPPYLTLIGAKIGLIRKHRYVKLLHDSYPQVAVWVGKVKKGSLIEKAWHLANRFMYKRAERSIVLCRRAVDLVSETYGIDRDTIDVIANWADGTKLTGSPKSESGFAEANGLADKFVVMYSGNMGLYYEWETILKAAELLKDDDRFRLVLIGGGGKKDWIAQQIKERNIANASMLPYQPYEKLNDSLSAADASLVTIAEGIEGISFPSKLYSSLAVARPVIALSEDNSELRDLIEREECGLWAKLGDAEGMAEKIRGLMNDQARAHQMGVNARSLFERAFTKPICSHKYGEVLRSAHPLIDEPKREPFREIG